MPTGPWTLIHPGGRYAETSRPGGEHPREPPKRLATVTRFSPGGFTDMGPHNWPEHAVPEGPASLSCLKAGEPGEVSLASTSPSAGPGINEPVTGRTAPKPGPYFPSATAGGLAVCISSDRSHCNQASRTPGRTTVPSAWDGSRSPTTSRGLGGRGSWCWLRSETPQTSPLWLRNVGGVQPVLGPGCSSPGVPVISKTHEESRGTHQQPLLGPRQLDSVMLLTMGVRRHPVRAERGSRE